MFNIVLVNPQIPNNTGAIGRLCVNTGATLHLIKPLGFDISEKAVRRAGLDYWRKIDLKVWENLEDFFDSVQKSDRFFYATSKTDKPYFEFEFQEENINDENQKKCDKKISIEKLMLERKKNVVKISSYEHFSCLKIG